MAQSSLGSCPRTFAQPFSQKLERAVKSFPAFAVPARNIRQLSMEHRILPSIGGPYRGTMQPAFCFWKKLEAKPHGSMDAPTTPRNRASAYWRRRRPNCGANSIQNYSQKLTLKCDQKETVSTSCARHRNIDTLSSRSQSAVDPPPLRHVNK